MRVIVRGLRRLSAVINVAAGSGLQGVGPIACNAELAFVGNKRDFLDADSREPK